MSVACRCPMRWQAYNAVKALKGAVAYEFAMVDGAPRELPFEPRVEYQESSEPKPWVVVF